MKTLALIIPLLALAVPNFCQNNNPAVSRFQYDLNTREIASQPVDTALNRCQKYLPLASYLNSWSDLGNTGLPALVNQYRPLRDAFNPLIFEGTDGYGTHNTNLTFYSANSPYSMVNYNSGGAADKNGQTINAIFGRNLKKDGKFTFLGNYSNSDGHFNRQVCNSSGIQANYILKRKNYSLISGLSRYSFKFNENGGLKNDDDLLNAYLNSLISVNLSEAATKMTTLTLQGVQSFSLSQTKRPADSSVPADSVPVVTRDSTMIHPDSVAPKNSLKLEHHFKISNISRRYTDARADSVFYRNSYSEDRSTNDSMRFLSWTNDISLVSDSVRIGKFPISVKGGVNPSLYRYQQADSVELGFAFGINGKVGWTGRRSHAVVAGIWNAAGYSTGDFDLMANYAVNNGEKDTGTEISLEIYSRGCSPDPVIKNYQSNHFRWSNDFLRQYESGLNLFCKMPAIGAELSAGAVTNMNRIYFDTIGMPAQLKDQMSVFSLRGSKVFAAGIFRSKVSVLAQHSTADAIRLPAFVGSTSTYMHHNIHFPKTKGELEVEYGFDLTYTSGFYGYAYMPATGVFYGENEKVLGNYPYMNIFAQMKVKRTRVFVSWCQTFAGAMAEESFAVLHYPSMRPHLKYGIYWHFYD